MGPSPRHEVVRDGREGRRLGGGQVEHLPCPAHDTGRGTDPLVPAQLDGVRVERGDRRLDPGLVGVGGDRDDQRPAAAGAGRPGQPRQRRGFVQLERPGRAVHDVEPDRVGAGGHGGEDAGLVGDAADLHERATRDVGRVVGRGAGRDEGAGGGRRVAGAHERFADQGAVEAERAPAGDGPGLAHARFGDDQPIVGDQVAQAPGALDVDLERPQVAVVEPDQPRPAGERPVELARVVDLDERLQPDRQRTLDEARESPGRVEDREQQHEVGARGAEERQLDLVDHEVLGEDRDRDRGPHRAQVVDRATEPMRLAQHGDRRRAAGLVGAGPRDDVLVVGRDPSGGR